LLCLLCLLCLLGLLFFALDVAIEGVLTTFTPAS